MTIKNTIIMLTGLSLAGAGAGAHASGHEAGGPSFSPLEIHACSFKDGKDSEDLDRVNARWNAWADKQGRDSYWAFMLRPMYHSSEIDFDFAWVGGWADGVSMGADLEYWLENGSDISEAYRNIIDCNITTMFAMMVLSPSPDPWRSGPVEFSNCTLKEGRTFEETTAAMAQWVAFEKEHGIDSGHFMLFPAYGENSEAEYDFKWVAEYSYAQFGENFDFYGTGGGWRKARELLERLMDCDSARVYHAAPVRTTDLED